MNSPDLAQALTRVAELERELALMREAVIVTARDQATLRVAVQVALPALDSVQDVLAESMPLASELRSAAHELSATRRSLRGAL